MYRSPASGYTTTSPCWMTSSSGICDRSPRQSVGPWNVTCPTPSRAAKLRFVELRVC